MKCYNNICPAKEYQKYHSAIGFPGAKKEKGSMINSKATDETIREMNSLIVQAKETAADTYVNASASILSSIPSRLSNSSKSSPDGLSSS